MRYKDLIIILSIVLTFFVCKENDNTDSHFKTLEYQCVKGDCKNGFGIMTWSDGSSYEGYWKNGQSHGEGVFKMGGKSGSIAEYYEGDFKFDKKDGYGTLVMITGDKYVGMWVNNKMEGKGTFYYSNGDTYTGNYLENLKHGEGTYFYYNGDKYAGEWRNNKQNGKGIYFYKDGNRIVCEWKDNFRHGEGLIIHNDGRREEAEWNLDMRIK